METLTRAYSSRFVRAQDARERRIDERERCINVGRAEAWGSMVSGSLLAFYGLSRRSRLGWAAALAGGALVYRGSTRHCPAFQAFGISTARRSLPTGVKIEKSVTVNRPIDEVYRFWRDLEKLPRFMQHLESVRVMADGRSHWVAKGLAPLKLEWDAEITHERENEVLGWRSLPGAAIENLGSVRFRNAPGGRGTEVRATIAYHPPGGSLGTAAARLLKTVTGQRIKEELRRFKEIMEVGEIPTTSNQPSGRAKRRAFFSRRAHRPVARFKEEGARA